ncbi:MAG: hypothetical protein D6734_00750 [Candidatus Schekmanbacteria bacterium]|nr:MAG: hypothetical protein D6734_00750 [Candidatus Schekmanbacteria bacterium]
MKKKDAFVFTALVLALAVGLFVYAQNSGPPSYLGHTADSISVNIPGKGSMTLQEAIDGGYMLSFFDIRGVNKTLRQAMQDGQLNQFALISQGIKKTTGNYITLDSSTDFKVDSLSSKKYGLKKPKTYIVKIGPFDEPNGCHGITAIGFVSMSHTTGRGSYQEFQVPVSAGSYEGTPCEPTKVNFTYVVDGTTAKLKVYFPRANPRTQIDLPYEIYWFVPAQ